MKILLFGGNGQVGWELQRALTPLGQLTVAGHGAVPAKIDLRDPGSIVASMDALRPDVVVNAAAYTAVDQAEREPEIARAVNATAVGVMAREAARRDVLLVHYSTDYVFDGEGDRPWLETDPTGPRNAYGRSKLEGEALLQSAGCRHLLFRTSWVYAARRQNFLRTMLRLALERERISVVNDQFGAPTGAELIADVTAHAIRRATADHSVTGTYHLAAAGETSWHDYAVHAIESARARGAPVRVPLAGIVPVPASAYSTPARRPANSRLATDKLRAAFGLALPDWRVGVERVLAELLDHLIAAPDASR